MPLQQQQQQQPVAPELMTVDVAFKNGLGQWLQENVRVPVKNKDVSVKHFARDCLARFMTHRQITDKDSVYVNEIGIRNSKHSGASLFFQDRLRDVVYPNEKLYLELKGPAVETTDKRETGGPVQNISTGVPLRDDDLSVDLCADTNLASTSATEKPPDHTREKNDNIKQSNPRKRQRHETEHDLLCGELLKKRRTVPSTDTSHHQDTKQPLTTVAGSKKIMSNLNTNTKPNSSQSGKTATIAKTTAHTCGVCTPKNRNTKKSVEETPPHAKRRLVYDEVEVVSSSNSSKNNSAKFTESAEKKLEKLNVLKRGSRANEFFSRNYVVNFKQLKKDPVLLAQIQNQPRGVRKSTFTKLSERANPK